MDKHIFEAYKQFNKQNRRKLNGIAISVLGLLLLWGIALFWVAYQPTSLLPYAIVSVSLTIIIILMIIERTLYRRSIKENYDATKANRIKLYHYMNTYDIKQPEDIQNLKKRFEKKIVDAENQEKRFISMIGKVLISAIVPIFLTLLNLTMTYAELEDVPAIIIVLFAAMLSISLTFLGVSIATYACYTLDASNPRQMKFFVDDLQDILDFHLYDHINEAPQEKDVKELGDTKSDLDEIDAATQMRKEKVKNTADQILAENREALLELGR